MLRLMLIAIAVMIAAASSASAQRQDLSERVEADVSSRRIAIESDFAGIQVVVFGAVDNSKQLYAEQNLYDIAIVIRGPNEPTVVRKKDRTMGLWINQAATVFEDVPEYYAALSTRPLNEITSEDTLKRYQIGYEHLRFSRTSGPSLAVAQSREQPFRQALVRLKEDQRLYQERSFAVAFISRSLFRATVSLPTNVPVGLFDVQIYLFRGGELLDNYQTELRIEKSGFERFIYNLAYENSLIYGIAGVIIAILAGLAASAAFRKS